MRIGKVIGRLTHSVIYPTLTGGRFLILEVQDRHVLAGKAAKGGDTLIAFDTLGSGLDDVVAFTESREACQPFYPEKIVPLDAYVTAILDTVKIELTLD